MLTDLANRCKGGTTAVTVGDTYRVYRALAHLLHDQRLLLNQNNALLTRELARTERTP